MRLSVGVAEVADAQIFSPLVEEGKRGQILFARLHGEFIVVYRSRVEAGGRARLEPSYVEAQLYKAFGQGVRGRKARRSAFLSQLARYDFRVQIYARRNNDRLRFEYPAVCG